MKGNYIAKNMNIVNRNSVHKNLKRQLEDDDQFHINKELDEYYQLDNSPTIYLEIGEGYSYNGGRFIFTDTNGCPMAISCPVDKDIKVEQDKVYIASKGESEKEFVANVKYIK